MYRVVLSRAAQKALDRLANPVLDRILERLGELAQAPRPRDVKKLKGREAWRIRVGDYRVIYTISDRQLVVLIVEIGHRRDVYR